MLKNSCAYTTSLFADPDGGIGTGILAGGWLPANKELPKFNGWFNPENLMASIVSTVDWYVFLQGKKQAKNNIGKKNILNF